MKSKNVGLYVLHTVLLWRRFDYAIAIWRDLSAQGFQKFYMFFGFATTIPTLLPVIIFLCFSANGFLSSNNYSSTLKKGMWVFFGLFNQVFGSALLMLLWAFFVSAIVPWILHWIKIDVCCG